MTDSATATRIACPACGAEFASEDATSEPYPQPREAPEGVAVPERVLLCTVCGLGIADPMSDAAALEALYSAGEYWEDSDVVDLDPRLHPGHWALALARWAFVRPYLREGGEGLRILDVGAGHGLFGVAARRDLVVKVAEYAAVEKDPAMRRALEASAQPPSAVFDDITEAGDGWDVIVLSNILEHLPDPLALLTEVASRLTPDGVVFVDSPLRDHTFKADVFPHLLFFDTGSLAALLHRAGLETERVSGAGREAGFSPINTQRPRPLWMRAFERLFFVRRVLPAVWSAAAFDSYFGASRLAPDGTWVRAVASRGTCDAGTDGTS